MFAKLKYDFKILIKGAKIMKSKILKAILQIDKNKDLEPFIEDNYREFENGNWLKGTYTPLSDQWICENRKIAKVNTEIEGDLLKMAAMVRNDETLKFLFYHCSKLIFSLNKTYRKSVLNWPDFSPLLSEGKSSMFLLLLGFHAIDEIIAVHKTMNIPEDITLATCSDVGSRVLISTEFKNGEIGISLTCLNWLSSNFVAGRIFQIGRMQFHLVQFNMPFRVYKNQSSSDYKIIAEQGLRVTKEGLLDCAGSKLTENGWETELKQNNNEITAHQVDDSTGKILKDIVTFSLNEWEPVINADSLVMNIHIPRGGRITPDIWFDSINRAFEFYETIHKPAAKIDACVCFSWMFEPRLRKILSEQSGLIKLQDAVHLFPLRSSNTNVGIYFVFGEEEIDLDSAPTDNSLRKGMIEHLRKGGIFTGGSMIYFRNE